MQTMSGRGTTWPLMIEPASPLLRILDAVASSRPVILELSDAPVDTISSNEIAEPKVYPNPVNDVLHIAFEGDIQSIRLMSIDGIQMKVSEESVKDKQMDIHHLTAGMYFLWIQSADQWYPVKFNKL